MMPLPTLSFKQQHTRELSPGQVVQLAQTRSVIVHSVHQPDDNARRSLLPGVPRKCIGNSQNLRGPICGPVAAGIVVHNSESHNAGDARTSINGDRSIKGKPHTVTAKRRASEQRAARTGRKKVKCTRKIVVASKEKEADDESDCYEVEAIIGRKGVGPTVQYLVKWVGYDNSTWESPWNLDHCMEVVSEFENADAAKKQAAKAALAVKGSQLNENEHQKSGTSHVTTKPHKDISSNRPQQMNISVALPGKSRLEQGHTAVGILSHKPKELVIRRLEDADFLVHYADEVPNEFVSYAVCIRGIPAHVMDYMSRNRVLPWSY